MNQKHDLEEKWLSQLFSEPELADGGFSKSVLKRIDRNRWVRPCLNSLGVMAIAGLFVMLLPLFWEEWTPSKTFFGPLQLALLLLVLGISGILWVDAESDWQDENIVGSSR